MTAILAFLGPLAKLLEGVFSWLRDNQIRQQGRTEEAATITAASEKVEAAMVEAANEAPTTKGGVVAELERGEF